MNTKSFVLKNAALLQNQRQDFSSVKRLSHEIYFRFVTMETVMKGDDDVKLCKGQNLNVNWYLVNDAKINWLNELKVGVYYK